MQSTKTAANKTKPTAKDAGVTVTSGASQQAGTSLQNGSAAAGKILQPSKSFQDLILTLQHFWAEQGLSLIHI